MGLQIVKNLIIAKVRVCGQDKELVVRSDALQRENNDSLLNHVKLWEIISVLNHIVSRQVNPGVQVGQEIATELSTSLEPILIVIEHVFEVIVESVKKLFHKLIPDLWFQLVEELLSSNQVVIEVEGLLNEVFYRVIQVFRQNLGPGLVKSSKPDVEVFNSVIDDVLKLLLRHYDVVDGPHQEREESDTKELDYHLEHILGNMEPLDISVADGGQSGNNPVNRGNKDR